MSKTLAVLDESELKDGQMKEVSFGEEGKVLLARLGEKIHATSAFCTHVGGPLAKGVLSADGRVVCPWHGACFNVCTGDIEDSPAPNPIHSFPTHVADGKIYVTADYSQTLKANKAGAPKLPSSYSDAPKGLVIVGGGSATFHAVESLRTNGYIKPITILSKEKYAPIDRTQLSKSLITDPSKLEWRSPADLKIKYGVTLRTGVTATNLSIKDKTVTFNSPSSGDEKISYETLILATGGVPKRLSIEGADLKNVFTFRGVQDSRDVDAAAQEGKKMVVIGSSFISMELVVAVSKRKLASIDVVGTSEFPFERALGKQVGAGLKKYQESQGVKFHMQSTVEKLIPKEGEEGVVGGVVFNGQTIPADFVVMGVGVKPATQWLEGSGIHLESDGGIQVDQFLRVKGFEQDNIYAVGDIVHYPQMTGGMARIEHWNVAGNHGRSVGKTISGIEQPFTRVPIFWSAQGQQLRYCGVAQDWDDIIIKGDPGEMKFIAYYLKENKVIAVACMQNDPLVSKCAELMRLGLMPTPQELRDGKNPLDVDTSTTR